MKHTQPRKFKVGDRVTLRAGILIPGLPLPPAADTPVEVDRVDDPSWPSTMPYRIQIPKGTIPRFEDEATTIWVSERNLR